MQQFIELETLRQWLVKDSELPVRNGECHSSVDKIIKSSRQWDMAEKVKTVKIGFVAKTTAEKSMKRAGKLV